MSDREWLEENKAFVMSLLNIPGFKAKITERLDKILREEAESALKKIDGVNNENK
jgi:hypothetical protein